MNVSEKSQILRRSTSLARQGIHRIVSPHLVDRSPLRPVVAILLEVDGLRHRQTPSHDRRSCRRPCDDRRRSEGAWCRSASSDPWHGSGSEQRPYGCGRASSLGQRSSLRGVSQVISSGVAVRRESQSNEINARSLRSRRESSHPKVATFPLFRSAEFGMGSRSTIGALPPPDFSSTTGGLSPTPWRLGIASEPQDYSRTTPQGVSPVPLAHQHLTSSLVTCQAACQPSSSSPSAARKSCSTSAKSSSHSDRFENSP